MRCSSQRAAEATRRRVALLTTLAVAAAPGAVILDRLLARRIRGLPPGPLRMLEVLDVPIERAWAVVSDLSTQPLWIREMTELRVTTPGPTGVGTRGESTVRVLGIRVTDPAEVTAFDPPRRFAVRHLGAFTGDGVITLEPGADGTTTIVRWEETLVPPLLPHLLGALQAPVLRSVFQADLRRLKELVEQGAIE